MDGFGLPALKMADPGEFLEKVYKTQMGTLEKEQARQTDLAKTTVASLISSYNSAKSQPLQEQIVRTMKNYYGVLPPVLRGTVDPYIAHGPTSPAAEKKREFLRFNPEPQQPVLNEAPGAETTNRYLQAQYLFSLADHKRALNSFIYGVSAAGDKQNMIPLEDGRAAVRTAEGQVMILSPQELGLKELEEKYGFTAREMMLNPQGIPTGNKGFAIVGGRKITTEETLKPFEPDPTKRYGQRVINIAEAPKSAWDIDHPQSLRKFILDWKNPSTDDELVQDWRRRSIKEPKEVAEELSHYWPQYSFKVVDIKKEGWFKKVLNILPFVSSNPTSAVIPIRGKPIGLKDQTGYEGTYYYDAQLDLVSNGIGVPLGSYEEISRSVATKILPRKGATK